MFEQLKIIHWPDPRLRKISTPVTAFDERLRLLAGRMLELMKQAKGVGLAAPQVGINERLFVMNHTGKPEDDRVVVNPVLSGADGEEEGEEGCLSLPEINIPVLRSRTLHLRAQDLTGAFFEQTETGYIPRIWQHENDHLDGILLLDKMSPMQKMTSRKHIREMEEAYQKIVRG